MPEQKTDTLRISVGGVLSPRHYTAPASTGSMIDPFKDNQIFNGFVETVTNPVSGNKKTVAFKRPGVVLIDGFSNFNPICDSVSGAYTWKKVNRYYVATRQENLGSPEVFLNWVTVDSNGDPVAVSNYGAILQTTEIVSFSEINVGLKSYLFITDGTYGYFIDSDNPDVINQVDNTQVVDVSVTAGGSGYTATTIVTFSDPTTGSIKYPSCWYKRIGSTVTVTFAYKHGLTTSDRIYFDGISGGATDGAFAITGTTDTTITFTHGSSGTIADFSGCNIGVTARGTVEVSAEGAVIGVTLTKNGYGYTSAPTISFADAGSASETGATATAVLSGFPTPHKVRGTSLDGYMFLAKEGSSDIYQCSLPGELSIWFSDEFITVNQFPGTIQGLARQANQVIALKTDSIEFLYNAGNAEGSTLSRTQQAVIQIGCFAERGYDDREDILFFIGNTGIGGIGVWKIEGFKEQKVSTEYEDRYFNYSSMDVNPYADFNYDYLRCFQLRTAGHLFFIITLNAVTGREDNQPSLVYDNEEKIWTYWSYGNFVQQGYSSFRPTVCIPTLSVKEPTDPVLLWGAGANSNLTLFPCKTSNSEYKDLDITTTSPGTPAYKDVYFLWTTPIVDADNTARKRWKNLTVLYLGPYSGSSGNIYLYKNSEYSDAGQALTFPLPNITWTAGQRPTIYNLGFGRRNSFTIVQSGDTQPFCLEGIELTYTQYDH